MVKVFGSYSKLKSGYYDVVPNMSTMDLLDDFASATVATRNVTLVERIIPCSSRLFAMAVMVTPDGI
jgi:cell division protein YceG involved in septum cleavage